jgi:hypothetical protein
MLWTETHSVVAFKANSNEAFEIFPVSAASSMIYFLYSIPGDPLPLVSRGEIARSLGGGFVGG